MWGLFSDPNCSDAQGASYGDFVIFDVKKIKNFINGDLPKEFQGYPQSRNFKFFLYICVIVMRDIGIYRVIALYTIFLEIWHVSGLH